MILEAPQRWVIPAWGWWGGVSLWAAGIAVAAYAAVIRFGSGLGMATHLTDRFPWGIWITFDLCGVALAAGGFILAGTAHVFHARRFEPILRPTVLTSFILYQLVALILVIDLGRPYRFWHPLVMWQPNSVMFEITLCLTLYTVVLTLEFLPAVLEHLKRQDLVAMVHRLTLPAVIAGMILSTLHQSSFGSLFLIIPEKLNALWYTPILPVLFLVSAVSAGMGMVVVESFLCERMLGRSVPRELLTDLCRWNARVLWVYGALKIGDVLWRAPWAAASGHPGLATSWAAEILLGIAVPAWCLGRVAPSTSFARLAGLSALVVGGIMLNRVNVSWWGLQDFAGYVYTPSWTETMITVGCLLAGLGAFVAAVKILPVFPKGEGARPQ